ncbi:MAG: cell division protein ZapA [Prevotellaceae bacterium]|nr:cell division protein ZapA [Prevotellaceae bacterium]
MEENVEKQHITIHIYDTQISIMVPKEQEQMYREAGTMINERLNTYFGHYKGLKSDKEIIYYAMIDIALRCVAESKKNDVAPITDILTELSDEIKEALEKS